VTVERVQIVLDNLRVGGIQRLALDEAYSLTRTGKKVSLLVLEAPMPVDDIREVDSLFFQNHSLEIHFLPSSRSRQVVWFARYLKKNRPRIILCHSAKSVWIVKLASLLSLQKIYIVCFVHQLASLSSFSQRAKRFILFSLANQIRASSYQFILEFEKTHKRLGLINRWVVKKFNFDRMGIDLRRIKWTQTNFELIPIEGKPALIFNSRLTGWKGFETFLRIAELLGNEFQYILITTRTGNHSDSRVRFNSMATAKLFHGKSVSHFKWNTPSVHLYPTNYGPKVKYPQSIGLNVLECLSLGIPSIISYDSFETWPEFKNNKMIHTTSWKEEESTQLVRQALQLLGQKNSLLDEPFYKFIDIDQHVMRLQELFS